MPSIRAAWARLFPNPGFYGWTIVGVGFLCSMLSSPGQTFVVSLYLDHLIADLGISRVEMSSLYAGATLAAALLLPWVGGWADRVTARAFLTTVLVLLALAILGLASVRGAVGLAFAFFALRLLGQGAIGLGTLTATVRWFLRYRGRALAVVSLGFAFGELVFPGVVYTLIARLGWRGSLLVLAGAYLLVFVPFVARVTRERAAAGEPMDGGPARATVRADGDGTDPDALPGPEFSLARTLRTPVFWGLLLTLSMPPLLVTAVIFHQVALFETRGWSAALVPPAFMAFALGGVVMTYAMGLLLERVPTRYGVVLSLGLNALALLALAAGVAGLAGALLYGALLGVANGASKTTNSLVWPDYFGIRALGAVKGVVNAVRNGGTALGPPLAAGLMVWTGPTATILILAGVAALSGAVALGFGPPEAGVAEP